MKLIRMVDDYINDKKYSMIYKDNGLDIINYTKIIDFSSSLISIKYDDKIYYIEGNNLVISKMMDDEILITGNITSITFSWEWTGTMKDKIFRIFSSSIKIKVKGRNINNFIKRLIKNNINIRRVIPISYKEVDLIIDYNDLEEVVKYKTIYDIKIIKYYGKLKVLKLLKKNIFIISFLILGLIIIYILSNVIFDIEIVHSNSNIIKLIEEELYDHDVRKYSFVKSYDEIEKIIR